jgi:hypothetical protein
MLPLTGTWMNPGVNDKRTECPCDNELTFPTSPGNTVSGEKVCYHWEPVDKHRNEQKQRLIQYWTLSRKGYMNQEIGYNLDVLLEFRDYLRANFWFLFKSIKWIVPIAVLSLFITLYNWVQNPGTIP